MHNIEVLTQCSVVHTQRRSMVRVGCMREVLMCACLSSIIHSGRPASSLIYASVMETLSEPCVHTTHVAIRCILLLVCETGTGSIRGGVRHDSGDICDRRQPLLGAAIRRSVLRSVCAPVPPRRVVLPRTCTMHPFCLVLCLSRRVHTHKNMNQR